MKPQINTDKHKYLVKDNPLYFDLEITKIDKKTNTRPRSPQIVHTLGHVNFCQRPYSLQFNNNPSIHDKVSIKYSDRQTILNNRNIMLLEDLEPGLSQFMGKRILIDLFQKTAAKNI